MPRLKHILPAVLLATSAVWGSNYAVAQNLQPHKQVRTISMTTEVTQTQEVKQLINDLIQTATNYDVEALDRIYHDKMQVIMIDTADNLNTADKTAFQNLFASKSAAGDPPMNTWAKFHRIDVDGNTAHVLLSRKNDLSGQNMDLILSIDLIHEDDRWQVTREVIFLRPEDHPS